CLPMSSEQHPPQAATHSASSPLSPAATAPVQDRRMQTVRANQAVAVDMQALVSILPGLRWLIGLLIATVIIAALYFGRGLLIPLALAILLGFLLDPAVTRLKRWGLPRMVATLLVVSMALGALTGMG